MGGRYSLFTIEDRCEVGRRHATEAQVSWIATCKLYRAVREPPLRPSVHPGVKWWSRCLPG